MKPPLVPLAFLVLVLQGRSTSDKAIPIGSVGLLVTCDSGREYKAYDEMMRLLEEVRGGGASTQLGDVSNGECGLSTAVAYLLCTVGLPMQYLRGLWLSCL